MSPKLPSLTAAELERVVKRDGWLFVRQSGSHRIFRHPSKPGLVVIPDHSGDLRTGLLADTLKDAGLTSDDLRRLL